MLITLSATAMNGASGAQAWQFTQDEVHIEVSHTSSRNSTEIPSNSRVIDIRRSRANLTDREDYFSIKLSNIGRADKRADG